MKTYIIQIIISSLISFFLVILIGDPLRHYMKKFINNRETVKNSKKVINELMKFMPDLLLEMKEDNKNNPLNREFIIMNKGNIYNGKGEIICYYFEEHDKLKEKLDILENYYLIEDITFNNAKRYKMSEEFINLLQEYC